MIDIRQTLQYANYSRSLGWIVERIDGVNYFIKKLPLVGSIIKIQRPEEINFEEIERLTKKYRAFQIIIEPDLTAGLGSMIHNSLYIHGFKLSKSPYLPTKTLYLDLDISKQKLFISLKKDCKYALKRTERIKILEAEKLDDFRKAWKKAVGWKRYVLPLTHLLALKKSFKGNSLFLLDKDKNSGAIFLVANKTAYYWQAFTNQKGRRLQAQYKIVWEGILWAKKKGAKILDFEGIYDERFSNKSWLGFTHFKKSFGGYEFTYPGAFVKTRLIW